LPVREDSSALLVIQKFLSMAIAYFYFHAELNYFLPRHHKQVRISHFFEERVSPFQRCLRCNGLLESVDKQSIVDKLPETVRSRLDVFQRCQDCNRIYWKGSHYERLQQFIDGVLNSQIIKNKKLWH